MHTKIVGQILQRKVTACELKSEKLQSREHDSIINRSHYITPRGEGRLKQTEKLRTKNVGSICDLVCY